MPLINVTITDSEFSEHISLGNKVSHTFMIVANNESQKECCLNMIRDFVDDNVTKMLEERNA